MELDITYKEIRLYELPPNFETLDLRYKEKKGLEIE